MTAASTSPHDGVERWAVHRGAGGGGRAGDEKRRQETWPPCRASTLLAPRFTGTHGDRRVGCVFAGAKDLRLERTPSSPLFDLRAQEARHSQSKCTSLSPRGAPPPPLPFSHIRRRAPQPETRFMVRGEGGGCSSPSLFPSRRWCGRPRRCGVGWTRRAGCAGEKDKTEADDHRRTECASAQSPVSVSVSLHCIDIAVRLGIYGATLSCKPRLALCATPS